MEEKRGQRKRERKEEREKESLEEERRSLGRFASKELFLRFLVVVFFLVPEAWEKLRKLRTKIEEGTLSWSTTFTMSG